MSTPDPTLYLRGKYVVLDFEVSVQDGRYGSAIDPRNQLRLACWKESGSDVVHRRWAGEFEQADLIDAIKRADFIVAHNSKYELGWLRRAGVDLHDILVFDTKIAEYVLYSNLTTSIKGSGLAPRSTSLDKCAARRGYHTKDPIVDLWMKHDVNIDDMPRKWVEDRCVSDVRTTELVFKDQVNQLARSNRLAVAFTRNIFTPVLADLEFAGAHVDSRRVRELHANYTTKLNILESDFATLTGGINPGSPKQVANYLYDTLKFKEPTTRGGKPKRTGTGRRSASDKTIARLVVETEAQREFIDLRRKVGKVSAALSKTLNYLLGIVNDPARNDTFWWELHQTRTATQRTSSTGIPTPDGSIQGQNFPRAFKDVYTTRFRDWKIGAIDGSQLEFRVAAQLGRDAQAVTDILDKDFDIHVTSAAVMAGRTYADLYAAYKGGDKRAALLRQDAKPESYKPLYGGKVGTKKQEKWYAEFQRRYAGIDKAQKEWQAQVAKDRKLVTPWGLVYYWPHAKVSSRGHLNVGAQVCNYPVQGLATAEIIPIAVTHFWHRTRHLSSGPAPSLLIFNTVHDSADFECKPEVVPEVESLGKQAFTMDVYKYLRIVYNMDFDLVPLGVGIKVGDNLGDADETAYNIFPDGREVKVK